MKTELINKLKLLGFTVKICHANHIKIWNKSRWLNYYLTSETFNYDNEGKLGKGEEELLQTLGVVSKSVLKFQNRRASGND